MNHRHTKAHHSCHGFAVQLGLVSSHSCAGDEITKNNDNDLCRIGRVPSCALYEKKRL